MNGANESNLRVLLVSRTYPPTVGGMERFSYHLAEELSKTADITLLANRRGKAGLAYFLPYAVAAGSYLIKREKIDVVHLCDGLLGPVGAALKSLTGVPVTATVHGLDLTYQNELYQAALSRTIGRLDHLIAVSESTRRICEQRWPALAGRVSVVPNGVSAPPDQWGRLPSFIEARFLGKRVLLTVGRLIRRKGVSWFVRQILPQLPDDVVYAVAGDGPEKEAIERSAEAAGLSNRVVLLGRVSEDELEALYARADLFVMPNVVVPGDVEGFGLVGLEAAVRGLPVVAADLQGIPEAIRDGKNGYLARPGDAADFTEKLGEVLDLPAPDRRRLGKKFANYTNRHFSWERMAAAYAQELQSLTGAMAVVQEVAA